MVEVTENVMPIAKKHFLMRQLNNHIITEAEYETKVAPLEEEIERSLNRRLEQEITKLRESLKDVKTTTFSDGDIKKKVARILIDFLRPDFTIKEIKGIHRQAYKIMREECGNDD